MVVERYRFLCGIHLGYKVVYQGNEIMGNGDIYVAVKLTSCEAIVEMDRGVIVSWFKGAWSMNEAVIFGLSDKEKCKIVAVVPPVSCFSLRKWSLWGFCYSIRNLKFTTRSRDAVVVVNYVRLYLDCTAVGSWLIAPVWDAGSPRCTVALAQQFALLKYSRALSLLLPWMFLFGILTIPDLSLLSVL